MFWRNSHCNEMGVVNADTLGGFQCMFQRNMHRNIGTTVPI